MQLSFNLPFSVFQAPEKRSVWLNPFTIGLFVCLLLPALVRIAQQSWTTEIGAHGPIVLATGCWLLYHNGFLEPKNRGECGYPNAMAIVMLLYLPIYIFGRAYDFLFVEAFAVYIIFICWFYRFFGQKGFVAQAFPIFYFAFLIPIPGAILTAITLPLQLLVSSVAAKILGALGYPIAREGVSLVVAQYQLLVEDACSGLNSMVGLIAIGLFYIYILHNTTWKYAALLTTLIIPIAIFVNIFRVIGLILITYYYGDAAAQGFMHDTAGFVLFGFALVAIFAIDAALRRVIRLRAA